MKIFRQAKKRWEINLCVSTCLVKVTIMKLAKEHYFVYDTWRIQQSQGFLASHYWLLALIHKNNFGLKQRSNKKSKSLEEVLLRCRMFHNGFCCWCKMYSGYVFLHGNPSHKYGAFTLEGCYATDQGTLPTVVGLEKNWDEKGDKYIAFSHPGSGLDKSQC